MPQASPLNAITDDLAELQKELNGQLNDAMASLDRDLADLTSPRETKARTTPPSRGFRKTSEPKFARASQLAKPAQLIASPFAATPAKREHSKLSLFRDVAAAVLEVDIPHFNWLNYALFHAGVPPVYWVEVKNTGHRTIENLIVEIGLLPEDYGPAWQASTGRLEQTEQWRDEAVRLPLRLRRLKDVVETERATLQVRVSEDERVLWVRTIPIDVHPYNQWILIPEAMGFLATFVTPNREVIQQILKKAAVRLAERTGDASFDGYQRLEEQPERVRDQIAALHDTLLEDYAIEYINPPASFERSGQKIRFPEETIEHGRGTCMDLSVLLAALMEQAGLHPIIAVIPGHAFVGCWTEEYVFTEPAPDVVQDMYQGGEIATAIQDGLLLFVDSTTHTAGHAFDVAEAEGRRHVDEILAEAMEEGKMNPDESATFLYLVDVCACRGAGVTPLP
ncbi:MAG: hypothetical protein ABIP48_03355 [Planctomycetota bacterium]